MLEIKESIEDINKLRTDLYSILEQKSYNLNDSEVMKASECINKAIVTYSIILKQNTA
jgi:F0F1-type ATP synthase membrane subunit b/b'